MQTQITIFYSIFAYATTPMVWPKYLDIILCPKEWARTPDAGHKMLYIDTLIQLFRQALEHSLSDSDKITGLDLNEQGFAKIKPP